ncbi:T9SS type A sorting domain-containing protein [Hymenobacter setariae]|uniref:T9SS type A sorting domain-containing protein n=1 Tax=Hymenobacter setariae TaxID=2594794 RepID=A0A558C4J1_9BACT|nr:T9SS type A sorting domain-containing protein [Hymenobacter setariae]TVT43676.1 T9SS type A sorting domain-containing protein [Hymenobacter setariae]
MKSIFTLLLLAGGSLLAGSARAQYTFTDANLAPYKQDFNTLTGTLALTSGHLNTLPEVYAQANFYTPLTIGSNDGLNTAANYYHFGSADGNSADRSLGGVASLAYNAGIGYVGIRFKNGSSVTIKNLEVQYAMEQWYNSGRKDAANVTVSYLTAPVGTAIENLQEATGTWQTIAPLQVDAPSTSTVIASRDGNAAANRRVRQTTLAGINLLPGQEIMIRWAYALSDATNGNGLSIDDVVVTPETNVYYSKATGSLNDLASWGQNRNGSGAAPTSFSANNQTFYVLGAATDRIASDGSLTGILGTWTVSGTNSKIVVGAPATATTGTAALPASLYLEYNKNIAGTIDVSDGSTFVIRNTNPLRTFSLGSLSTSSTVEYNSTTTTSIITQSYGNLVIAGSPGSVTPSSKSLTGNVLISGSLRLKNQCSLNLGDYDLTLVRRDSVGANGQRLNANIVRGGSPTSYVATNGKGRLRISVPNNGVGIVFPVGTIAPSLVGGLLGSTYTPATLRQTAANSEDIFSVRVVTNLFLTYTLAEVGIGLNLSQSNVNKTWLVSEEVPGGSDLTMTLQWNAADATPDFVPATARLKHYTGGAWDENASTSEWGAGAAASTYTITRSGIKSFSPFGVVSNAAPLPVKLTAFETQATGTTARCTWTTASETNNDHFVVERSLDGVTFAALGTIKGQGTSATAHTYSFTDAEAGRQGATLYYRLQQVDIDGKTSYSPVRAVTFAARAVALYPTPTAGDAATLDLTSLAAQPCQAQVFDLAGRVLLTRTLVGGLTHEFDVRSLPAGAYMVVLSGAGVHQTLPLLRK